MSTYSPNVTCYEVDGSRSENFDMESGAFSASVDLMCTFTDRYSLIVDLLGSARSWPFSSSVFPPRARSAGIKSFTAKAYDDGQALDYDLAVVSVNYTNAIQSASGNDSSSSSSAGPYDLFSEEMENTVEFLKLPYEQFRWGAQNGAAISENEAPGQQFFSMKLNRTIYQVPGPLPTWLQTLIGCVNDEEYVSSVLGLTFAAETLLFMPTKTSRTIGSDLSSSPFTIGLAFAYKPQGWNKYYRAQTQTYESLFVAKTGDEVKSYTPTDMSEFLI